MKCGQKVCLYFIFFLNNVKFDFTVKFYFSRSAVTNILRFFIFMFFSLNRRARWAWELQRMLVRGYHFSAIMENTLRNHLQLIWASHLTSWIDLLSQQLHPLSDSMIFYLELEEEKKPIKTIEQRETDFWVIYRNTFLTRIIEGKLKSKGHRGEHIEPHGQTR